MRTRTVLATTITTAIAALLASAAAIAQPPGITMDMINTVLPEEGAPLAVAGPYSAVAEAAHDAARYIVHRPSDLAPFPATDTLPLVVWGNGGCAIDNPLYAGFLDTIVSHGFIVVTTVGVEGDPERRSQTPDDLLGAIAWAEAENARSGSPLAGKIDLEHIAVMGQSCGGFLSVSLGTDPRVDTIGVFNSGVSAPGGANADPTRATTDTLADVHGPILFINGHERDFLMATSRDNFDRVNHVATFYGARHGAGHTATMYHAGGGEFANVASNWVKYHFKGDAAAGKMFVGADCELCVNENWETDAKGL
jgi:dienelactone hydrolase